MDTYAQRYGGHQFGNWAGQLGDGRAITLGEVDTGSGVWELQLKGSERLRIPVTLMARLYSDHRFVSSSAVKPCSILGFQQLEPFLLLQLESKLCVTCFTTATNN